MSDAPTGTYRLQLHAGFDLDAAAEQVPYLARLGVSHLYLSPVLQAAPGSMHGYDVVDHTQVSTELGGEPGLDRLAEACRAHELRILVDVVPNHMALPTPAYLNQSLWSTLRHGPEAPTAHWFDVDWDQLDGRFGLPVLGDTLESVLSAGELSLDEVAGKPVVRYHEQAFPVAPGTESGDVAAVVGRQHYLLGSWRDKEALLNYRRFFDVDTLVAVRVELDDVFAETHRVLLDLHARGVMDGFRIDHPDGLADPQGYLDRLAHATGGAWVVAEKILEGDESLPAEWAAAGTTGYDAIRVVQQALVPDTGTAVDAVWRDAGGASFHDVESTAKRDSLELMLQPELSRLQRAASAVIPHHPAPRLREALAELLLGFAVYRAYVRRGEPAPGQAHSEMDAARDRAVAQRPDLRGELADLRDVLLDTGSTDPAGRDLLVRFGQVCGPVMAKGVEDTAFYRHHRLVALNEVGGCPDDLERPDPASLHAWATRQSRRHPTGLTTGSTHDTKRSADVRARLLAAAGDPAGWQQVWSTIAADADHQGVDRPTAALVLQTVVGAWPVDAERLGAYLTKAVREAKQHSRWDEPDEDYERRVTGLGERLLDDPTLRDPIVAWVERIAPAWRCTVLAQTLVQLTLPGVPDTYQGDDLVALNLVDPDNRRPVDFAERARRLDRLDTGADPDDLTDEKLLVVSRTLRLRRARPELYGPEGDYAPIQQDSPYVLGFVRAGVAMTLVTRWPQAGSGADLCLDLGGATWRDELTGDRHTGRTGTDRLFSRLPVALLVRTEGGGSR